MQSFIDRVLGHAEHVKKVGVHCTTEETTEPGQKLMDSLGAALRNTDDVETVLTLNGGGTIKGADLKLTGPVRLTSEDGQVSADEVFEEMRKWLLSKVSSDEVSAS